MRFPLTSADILLWLGLTAILLWVTSELISPYYGQIGLLINKKRLRLVASIFLILFLLDVLIYINEIFTH